MKNVKVVKVDSEGIEFDNGMRLYSFHDQDCCEHHYLSFDNLTIEDFNGLEFDITNDEFFERIEDYGIALNPTNGHPVRIAGYGSNNGYYSSNLELIIADGRNIYKQFDITECQEWND